MKVALAGMELVNPVIAASGTFGYGIEFEEIVSLERLGGFVTKGISLEPMAGHAPPRIVQTAAGMLNAIGLQNVGVEDFIARKLPPMSAIRSCKVIVNVFGYTVERVRRGDRAAERGGGDCGLRAECVVPERACGRDGVSERIRIRWKTWWTGQRGWPFSR